jgi:hypothetical protein
VFTARYALSPYIKQIRFVFKGLMLDILPCSCFSHVFILHHLLYVVYTISNMLRLRYAVIIRESIVDNMQLVVLRALQNGNCTYAAVCVLIYVDEIIKRSIYMYIGFYRVKCIRI